MFVRSAGGLGSRCERGDAVDAPANTGHGGRHLEHSFFMVIWSVLPKTTAVEGRHFFIVFVSMTRLLALEHTSIVPDSGGQVTPQKTNVR